MVDVLVLLTEATNGGTNGGLTQGGREALAVASRLAGQLGGALNAALTIAGDAATAELGECGAARVFAPARGETPDRVAFAAEAVRQSGVRVVVVSRGAETLAVVPRLAARLAGGCAMGVTEVNVSGDDIEATAAIYGGAARALYHFSGDGPRIVALAPGGGSPAERVAGRIAELVTIDVPADPRLRIIQAAVPSEGARLEDARIVVSGGRGLRDRENYGLIRELSAALGGMPGASRAIVDESWAKPAEQVGLTGKIVTPDLYFAIGISGASQHMAGCSNARTLVAVNTDADAPIFRYAHYGIVDNCLDILPELIRQAKDRGRNG